MERKAFSPGGSSLVTTYTNSAASGQLRSALLNALTDAAAVRFDNRDDFLRKGFEMVKKLREAYAPTGTLALMANFSTLTSLKMGPKNISPLTSPASWTQLFFSALARLFFTQPL